MQMVGGRTLVQRAIYCANLSECCAVVSTQDAAIAAHARDNGAQVHERPAELADAVAQIEPSIAHWWSTLTEAEKPDAIVLRHPTHCFVTRDHVREALSMLARNSGPVVGVRDVSMDHEFSGECYPLFGEHEGLYAFDPLRATKSRPRSQDGAGKVWRETGSLYAFSRWHWETVGDRMWGSTGDVALKMDDISSMDIDTPDQLAICQAAAEATGR